MMHRRHYSDKRLAGAGLGLSLALILTSLGVLHTFGSAEDIGADEVVIEQVVDQEVSLPAMMDIEPAANPAPVSIASPEKIC